MAAEVIHIVQITDFHISSQTGEKIFGVDTHKTLTEIIARICAEKPKADAVVATGDLSADGSLKSYLRLKPLLGQLALPVYCLPGNHDIQGTLREHLRDGNVDVCRSVALGNWGLVFLDSTVPGEEDGQIGQREFRALRAALRRHRDRDILVCLHHEPVPMGGAWGIKVSLTDALDLFRILDQYPRVRGLIWGHTHQTYDGGRKGVRLMGTPSTCYPFPPGQESPGWRRIALYADGGIETRVRRATGTSRPA